MGDLPKMAIFEVPPWGPQKIFEIFLGFNPTNNRTNGRHFSKFCAAISSETVRDMDLKPKGRC